MDELLHAWVSDPGRRRRDNEDRCLADPAAGLFLVADGMADAVSPQLVVDWLPEMLRESLPLDALDTPARVREALGRLSDRVHVEALRCSEMIGTTLALVLVRGGIVLVAHLGDSRVYLCRDGKLEALTRDHSFVQRMIDAGELEGETAELRRWNGGPTRFVGMARTPAADVRVLPLLPGDRLLLCSDGLTGELDDKTIRDVLCESWPPERTCQELVDRANAAGGNDNITAVVLAAGRKAGPAG